MYLDFTNEKYRNIAFNNREVNYETAYTKEDAFLIVLNGLDYETIDNLCTKLSLEVNKSANEVYRLIQSFDVSEEFKRILLDKAFEIIHSGEKLGSKKVGNHNASSWISHSLLEGEVASNLAKILGLDENTAMKLGILHDVGRKFDHSFLHTIKGFEYLIDKGYGAEAFACLTHSFLSMPKNKIYKGNRCANCDPLIEGFYIDKDGNGTFLEGIKKDDATKFLDEYEYNSYDIILNISDLMAKSTDIVSPYERVLDVYTKKAPDKNSPFFKVCFINALNMLMFVITRNEQFNKTYNLNDFDSLEKIDSMLIDVSSDFMNVYELKTEKNKKNYIF